MDTSLTPFRDKVRERFPDLYQPFGLFVKQNSWNRALVAALGVVILLLLLLLVISPQPGQCLTAEEIGHLKKAGVSDDTIQLMIEQEREQARDSPTGIWDVENEDGSRSTIYRVDDGDQASERRRIEREKVDRAWEMLRNLIIDARESD